MAEISWVLLCSFWGKNAKDVIEHYANINQISKIKLIIYEAENCGAATAADKYGITAFLMKPKQFPNQYRYQQEILKKMELYNISHVFLLGYQYLIRKEILDAFPNRIANVHPSLFPSFLGTKTAIHDALSYGVKITGITTHIIDDEYDKGIILFQEAIRISDNETFESIYPQFSKIGLCLIMKTMDKLENEMI